MKIILIVLDSLGVGELPDADKYGDTGSNTLGNILKSTELDIPNLTKMGLLNILRQEPPGTEPIASYGKMAEKSAGKDTITGHWEICGVVLEKPFPVFPNGFPAEIIDKFERLIGRKVIGNIADSGTEIIQRLGEEHLRTGNPIVYTSADSVFQIAAHENVVPLSELYKICQIARDILVGDNNVARVIARPFLGESAGNFIRTDNRKDYSVRPPKETVLDKLKANLIDVLAIGKISDIFLNQGISQSFHTHGNSKAIEQTLKLMKGYRGNCLIFSNLVDFDTLYGHRNDILGYGQAIEQFDRRIPEIINNMEKEDWLIITADHGCDPSTESTDHSREYVPVLIYNQMSNPIDLGIRESFADLGETVLELFNIDNLGIGYSFAGGLRKN